MDIMLEKNYSLGGKESEGEVSQEVKKYCIPSARNICKDTEDLFFHG